MNPTIESAISARSLGKRFRNVVALDSVDLDVACGEIFALIGPNGAGKTTLLKTVLNLLPPTRGSAKVLGLDSRRIGPEFFQRVGYVSESQRLPRQLSVTALFRYLERIHGNWDRDLVKRLAGEFELPLGSRIGALSRGGQAKVRVICGTAHRPELLIVDEMFAGLDPLIRDQLMEGVLHVAAESGWTVVLSSHEMAEVERLAESVAFLDRGRIAFAGSIGDILDRHRLIEVRSHDPLTVTDRLPDQWIERRLGERCVQIVETLFDPVETEQRIKSRYGPDCQCRVNRMSLRDIFVARVRKGRLEAGS